MMRVAVILFSLCCHALWVNSQSINLKASTTIHVDCPNLTAALPLVAQIYHVFPAYDLTETTDTLSAQQSQVWLQCPLRIAQTGYLFIGDDKIKLYLVPGDTVHIQLTKHLDQWIYAFQGSTQVEQLYYLEKRKQFPIEPNQLAMAAGTSAKTLGQFQCQLDSLTKAELRFWQLYQTRHRLSSKFIRFETDAIRYGSAFLRLTMVGYQLEYQKKKQVIPGDYYVPLRSLPIQNKAAQYDYYYLLFLREYIHWKIKTTNGNALNQNQYPAAFKKWNEDLLGSELGSFYRLWTLSGELQDDPKRVQTQLKESKFLAHYRPLVIYLEQASASRLTVLRPGDKAPNFFLSDPSDSLVSLSAFRGEVVYLCFWYVGCGGCQYEFPFENKLVDEFAGQGVTIISICIRPEKWLETIQKEGLRTTNLVANRAWQKRLEDNYGISVYPHYVLINQQGELVENYTSRPSADAASKIRQVLATKHVK